MSKSNKTHNAAIYIWLNSSLLPSHGEELIWLFIGEVDSLVQDLSGNIIIL